jgi:torulene dioxygenase
VTDPKSQEEDGGVVLSVMLNDVAGKSYLLILNAKDFKELKKANINKAVGFRFHSTHVPQKTMIEG